jgi:hypothetical protein
MIFCARCANERWVCEAHPDRPWDGEHGCPCGAPGSPCPVCNKADAVTVPEMPDGFVAETSREVDLPIDTTSDESLADALARIARKAMKRN